MKVREVTCKQALSPCGIPGLSYSLNPYTGCQHSCIYCYARFMCRYRGSLKDEKWGSFVDVKINIHEALAKEIETKKQGRIMISSVTDGYQSLEKKYRLTRKCLEVLARHDFPVSILTKSSIIENDLDILLKMKNIEVGFTLTCPDDNDRKILEPFASKTQDRLRVLKRFSEKGLNTYVFFGPFFPGISDKNLEEFIKKIADAGASYIMLDKLNVKYGNWKTIEPILSKHYPELLGDYQDIFFKGNDYYKELKERIQRLCKENEIRLEVCYQ